MSTIMSDVERLIACWRRSDVSCWIRVVAIITTGKVHVGQ